MLTNVFLVTALVPTASAQCWLFGCDSYVQESLDYAQLNSHWYYSDLLAGVRGLGLGSRPTIDLLWPGNGYDQAFYAGQYAVLKYLEKNNVLRVGRIMGGSGGATAALLALASEETGVEAARLMTESFEAQADLAASELEAEYLKRITNSFGWLKGTITRDLNVALLDGNSDYTVVYNLQNPMQAATAVLGSGEFFDFPTIPGVECIGATSDGGIMSAFNTNQRATIYVAAWHGNNAGCDRSCIHDEFMKGVDMTIELLTSSDYVVPAWSCDPFWGCSGMILSKTGTAGDLGRLASQHLLGGSPARQEPDSRETNLWVDAASHCNFSFFGRRRKQVSSSRLLGDDEDELPHDEDELSL